MEQTQPKLTFRFCRSVVSWLGGSFFCRPELFLLEAMLFIVPPWKKVYADFQVALPWSTVQVIRISDWFIEYWYVYLIGVGIDHLATRALGRPGNACNLLFVFVSTLMLASLMVPALNLMQALAR